MHNPDSSEPRLWNIAHIEQLYIARLAFRLVWIPFRQMLRRAQDTTRGPAVRMERIANDYDFPISLHCLVRVYAVQLLLSDKRTKERG